MLRQIVQTGVKQLGIQTRVNPVTGVVNTIVRTKTTQKNDMTLNPKNQVELDFEDPSVKAEGGDRVIHETKHIHDQVKDVEDGHVHCETKDIDVDIKMTEKCQSGTPHQPDYSGKLWEGEAMTVNPTMQPGGQELPESWEEDLNDPNVKGEGGDRVLFESRHLHNAQLENDQKAKQIKTGKNLK